MLRFGWFALCPPLRWASWSSLCRKVSLRWQNFGIDRSPQWTPLRSCNMAPYRRCVWKLDRQAKWPSLYPNLQDFPRKTRNQRMKEDDVGDFNATWPRYRITSHVQGLKGGAVLNGTMAVELFEEVVCLCHDSSWVVLSYPFLLAGFKMTDKRNSFDKVWIDLQGKTRCE